MWISVTEQQPPPNKLLVAYGPNIYCFICQLQIDEEGASFVGPYMSAHPNLISHWIVIPEPPKEEEE